MITDDKVKIFQRILNAFENDSGSPETDYSSVYIYHDGNNHRRQVTLARGFTDDGGNLKKVIQQYISNGGQQSDFFQSRMNKFGTGVLVDDKDFIQMLHTVSTEKAMQDSQDKVFTDCYLQPALDWSSKRDFGLPLSSGVVVDSYLHSGSMLQFLMRKFPEKLPSNGGNEKDWIEEYLHARRDWLANHSNPVLRTTVYRPDFFLGEIRKGNWDLDCPLVAHDVKVC